MIFLIKYKVEEEAVIIFNKHLLKKFFFLRGFLQDGNHIFGKVVEIF